MLLSLQRRSGNCCIRVLAMVSQPSVALLRPCSYSFCFSLASSGAASCRRRRRPSLAPRRFHKPARYLSRNATASSGVGDGQRFRLLHSGL